MTTDATAAVEWLERKANIKVDVQGHYAAVILDHIAAKDAEIERAKAAEGQAVDAFNKAYDRAEKAEAALAKAREALEWYASDGEGERFQIIDDKGEVIANFADFTGRAKATLARIDAALQPTDSKGDE